PAADRYAMGIPCSDKVRTAWVEICTLPRSDRLSTEARGTSFLDSSLAMTIHSPRTPTLEQFSCATTWIPSSCGGHSLRVIWTSFWELISSGWQSSYSEQRAHLGLLTRGSGRMPEAAAVLA